MITVYATIRRVEWRNDHYLVNYSTRFGGASTAVYRGDIAALSGITEAHLIIDRGVIIRVERLKAVIR